MARTLGTWGRWATILATVGTASSCGDSEGGAEGSEGSEDGSTSSVDSGAGSDGGSSGETDAEPCDTPGVERCPCIDGECIGDLVCLSDVCVMPPTPPPTTGDGDTSDTGGTDTGTGGTTACATSTECPNREVCYEELCRPAHDCVYDVVVFEFVPYAGCSEGGIGGNYDLFYSLSANNQQIHESNWYQGGCPGGWSDETAKDLGQDGFDRFFLRFYDEETGANPIQVDTLCFDDGAGMCGGPLPASYLHAGMFDGQTGNGSDVVTSFTPTSCG